jgi:FtsH-binding integral membrane protein
MPRKTEGAKTGIDWTVVSQNVALGVVIVILSYLAVGVGLHRLPLVGVVFQFFVPFAFVVLMTYYRSEQKTRAQSITEGIFAGCIFLLIMSLVFALFSLVRPPTA